MAKKRMFSLGVLETDAFMDMPLSAQALYFHLNMRADDDGFIGNPKRITRNIGASEDDLKILIAKRFVLAFEDGVIVIKHWRMHNAIKKDRYTKTNFIDDLNTLHLKENGSYSFKEEVFDIEDSESHTTSALPDNGTQTENEWNTNGTQMENEWNTDGEQMSQPCSTGLVLGLDIDKINNPPLSPLGENEETLEEKINKDFSQKTNIENVKDILNNGLFPDWQYIKDNPKLWQAIKDWLEYKDCKKPKSQNHYTNIKSMNALLKKFVTNAKEHSVDYVVGLVEDAMCSTYTGIVWNKKGGTRNNVSTGSAFDHISIE